MQSSVMIGHLHGHESHDPASVENCSIRRSFKSHFSACANLAASAAFLFNYAMQFLKQPCLISLISRFDQLTAKKRSL